VDAPNPILEFLMLSMQLVRKIMKRLINYQATRCNIYKAHPPRGGNYTYNNIEKTFVVKLTSINLKVVSRIIETKNPKIS
jgi:hypothetical protein